MVESFLQSLLREPISFLLHESEQLLLRVSDYFRIQFCRFLYGAASSDPLLPKLTQQVVPSEHQKQIKIVAVNYHFTRKCNYSCGFCFHTAKTSHVEPLETALKIIRMLRDKGCDKINFAGGEPFLPQYRSLLGEMVKFAKLECEFPSVSIISNGVYVTKEWFLTYGKFVDILGISCDSCNEKVNEIIGRGKGNHIPHVRRAAALCHQFGVLFKMNTVVNQYNWDENMSELVAELRPFRWKIFQVLPLEGENTGANSLRNVHSFLISSDQFETFVEKHRKALENPSIMKVESNDVMQASYILVDEYGRFLDSSAGGKQATDSMLDVGIDEALRQLISSKGGGFNEIAFVERDGNYTSGAGWSRACGKTSRSNLSILSDGSTMMRGLSVLSEEENEPVSDLGSLQELAPGKLDVLDIEDLGRTCSQACGGPAGAV